MCLLLLICRALQCAWLGPLFSISGWKKEDDVGMGRALVQDLSFPSSAPHSAQTLCMAWGKSFNLYSLSVNSWCYGKDKYCQGREEPERDQVTSAVANITVYHEQGGKRALFPGTQPKSTQDGVNEAIT